MNRITVTTILQESNISKNSQRIILRYFGLFFEKWLVLPECDINVLGQDYVPNNNNLKYQEISNSGLSI